MNMMPHENFTAARIYVRVMRVITNVTLMLITLAGVCWAAYVTLASITHFWDNSEERAAQRDRVAAIPAERDKKLADLQAELAQKEKNATAEREANIQRANAEWQLVANSYNSCAAPTLEMVKKAAPETTPDLVLLSIKPINTAAECQSLANEVSQVKQFVDNLKNALYAGIDADIAALKAPISQKRSELQQAIAPLEQVIAANQAEIARIKAKYKDTREVITYFQQKDSLLKGHSVYDFPKNPDDEVAEHARKLARIGYTMPGMTQRLLVPNPIITKNDIQPLTTKVARLSAWLPTLVVGEKIEQRSKEEIPMNPLVLSAEDYARVQELHEQINQKQLEINKLEQELTRYKNQLANIDSLQQDIHSSKDTVMANWKLSPTLEPLSNAVKSLQDALADVKSLKEEYEKKKQELIQGYEKETQACIAKEEELWQQDCQEVMSSIHPHIYYTFLAIISAWLIWIILTIIIDFATATLVAAVRAQAVHEAMQKK